MKKEFFLRNLKSYRQLLVPVEYKGLISDTDYRLYFLFENEIVVALKALDGLLPIHEAQLPTYMKLLNK